MILYQTIQKVNKTIYSKIRNKNTFDKISISEKDIISNLTNVYDPEIPVNIYDLGLIYDINISKGNNEVYKNVFNITWVPCCG